MIEAASRVKKSQIVFPDQDGWGLDFTRTDGKTGYSGEPIQEADIIQQRFCVITNFYIPVDFIMKCLCLLKSTNEANAFV